MFLHVCPVCNHRNPRGSRFCNDCGSPLQLRFCPNCGGAEDVLALRCHACGTALPDLATAESQDLKVDAATEEAAASMIAAVARDAALTVGAQPSAPPLPTVRAEGGHAVTPQAAGRVEGAQAVVPQGAARAEPLTATPPATAATPVSPPSAAATTTEITATSNPTPAPNMPAPNMPTPNMPVRSASIIERLYPKGPDALHSDLPRPAAMPLERAATADTTSAPSSEQAGPARPFTESSDLVSSASGPSDSERANLEQANQQQPAAAAQTSAPALPEKTPQQLHPQVAAATESVVPAESPSVLGDTAIQADDLFAPESSRIALPPLPDAKAAATTLQARGSGAPPRAPLPAAAVNPARPAANVDGQRVAQRIAIGALLFLVVIVGALVYSLRQQFMDAKAPEQAAPQPITTKAVTAAPAAPANEGTSGARPVTGGSAQKAPSALSSAASSAPSSAASSAASSAPPSSAHAAPSSASADPVETATSSQAPAAATAAVPPSARRPDAVTVKNSPAVSAAPTAIKRAEPRATMPRETGTGIATRNAKSNIRSSGAPPTEQRPCTAAIAALGLCELPAPTTDRAQPTP